MKPPNMYLQSHKGIRTVLICLTLLFSSVALFFGIGIYAFTTGPMAIGHYVRERFIGTSLVILSLLLSGVIAWMLKSTRQPLRTWLRYALSFGASLVGGGLLLVGVFWPLLRP